VGSKLSGEPERSTVLRTVGRSNSRQQKDDKSKLRSKGSKAITGVTWDIDGNGLNTGQQDHENS
jgi:hypothetical protein